jgi:hypothetical protein
VTAASFKVDRDALLCALVLAPTTFARNRFFALYTEPWAKKTRSRAAQLRTVVRQLAALTPKPELRELVPLDNGGGIVRYGLPDLHFERTATLEPLELAVVRFALARRPGALPEGADSAMRLTDEDRKRVERALAKLSQKIGLPAVDELQRSTHSTPPTTGES